MSQLNIFEKYRLFLPEDAAVVNATNTR